VRRYLAAAFACIALLAGCETKIRWRDTTGLGRSEAEEDRIVKYCEGRNIPPDFAHHLTPEKWETAIKACMAGFGWTPILHQTSN
jgi:hypothetical protein